MDTNKLHVPMLGPEYFENRAKIPREELAKYAGMYVAYSWDGKQIVASGADEDEVERRLAAMGSDPLHAVIGFIDPL
jgi:hypothetical protein